MCVAHFTEKIKLSQGFNLMYLFILSSFSLTQRCLISLLSQPACLHPEWHHHPPARLTLTVHDIMAPCALTASHSRSQAYKILSAVIQTVMHLGNYTWFGNLGPLSPHFAQRLWRLWLTQCHPAFLSKRHFFHHRNSPQGFGTSIRPQCISKAGTRDKT